MTTRQVQQALLIILASGITAACAASRPVKYYVLDTGPAATPESSVARFPIKLLVGRVTASHLYRDDRLVYGSGPVQLGTYEYQRWAEPPAGMIEDMLIRSLQSTGAYRSVSGLRSNARGDYIVRGHLAALNEVEGPVLSARFSFQLELFDPKTSATIWSDSYAHDEPVTGKKVSDVVEALDRNVSAGLAQLTSHLGQYFAAHPPEPAAAQ
ncbi:MAG TPA: ABC-type transport auxiliary lipoprotein family protein [Verrucomicrobiae bacterium]|nr:ABC-type transport auxiliary lipoprotein family protein [Verrucomicrobiae bacterium]